MSHKIVWVAGIVSLLLAGIIGYMSLSSAQEKPTGETSSAASAALTVTTAAAQYQERPGIIDASGPIAAWQEAIIGAEVAGQRLTAVNVDVGDTVTKGQVLAVYNDATLKAQVEELKAAYAQAAGNRKRALALRDSGAMSAQEIDSFVHEATMAKARLDAKNLELRYTNVLAPDDGVIAARTATLGEVGAVGQELFRLIRQNRLEWRGELTAAQLMHAQIGQKIILTLPDGSPAEATIRQISPSLDNQTRLAVVYADIKPDSAARAGMYASGRIERDVARFLTVPSKAVVIRDGYSYVFTVTQAANGASVVQQKIMTGDNRGGHINVMEGLQEGDIVVLQGAGFLNDGDTVHIVEGGSADKQSVSP